ncbi:MAG: hypothetical protein ABJA66_06945 [Actinomycetota bacterium]
MPNFEISNKIASLIPTEKINVEKLGRTIENDPDLVNDFKKILIKKGISSHGIFQGETIFQGPFKTLPANPPTPAPPTPAPPTPAPPEQIQPDLEIDTKLQLLISSIPIANSGNIITSEYHNALRDAVRGLASKIGLSVNPTAEFKILTFAPDFMAMTPPKDSEIVNLKWDVTLNRAATPQVGANDLKNPVSGGFVVQLPDSATIYQMIARGARGASAPNPKNFKIALKRMKFGKDQIQTLISMDLTAVKEGLFEANESVKLSDSEADLDNDVIAGAKIFDRKIVNNETWMYFVTAEWSGSDDTSAAKFEINSIQILCTV